MSLYENTREKIGQMLLRDPMSALVATTRQHWLFSTVAHC